MSTARRIQANSARTVFLAVDLSLVLSVFLISLRLPQGSVEVPDSVGITEVRDGQRFIEVASSSSR